MDRLLEGYRRFRARIWPTERKRYEALAKRGQSPETLVIACSDSRVDPQTVFGAAPGELFVIRNVAGLVPPHMPDAGYHGTSAALEYAVRVLKVTRIAVLGHARCGGVAVMTGDSPGDDLEFVTSWMEIAAPAVRALPNDLDGDARVEACEREVVRLSLANLMTFPWIAGAVTAGRLTLEGFRFDVSTGVLMKLDGDRFLPVG